MGKSPWVVGGPAIRSPAGTTGGIIHVVTACHLQAVGIGIERRHPVRHATVQTVSRDQLVGCHVARTSPVVDHACGRPCGRPAGQSKTSPRGNLWQHRCSDRRVPILNTLPIRSFDLAAPFDLAQLASAVEGRSDAVIHSLALRARIFGTSLLLARSASEWISRNFASHLDNRTSTKFKTVKWLVWLSLGWTFWLASVGCLGTASSIGGYFSLSTGIRCQVPKWLFRQKVPPV